MDDGIQSVFITGISGYLARHVIAAIRKEMPSTRLIGLVPPGETAPPEIVSDSAVSIVPGDLRDSPDSLSFLLSGCGSAVHLAGYGLQEGQTDWKTAFEINVEGSFRLALAARAAGVRRVVFAQSALEYGPASPGVREQRALRETDPCFPEGVYGSTKYAGARLAGSVCADAGITFVGLRIFNTYGPAEQRHKLIPSNILASLRGASVPMTSGAAVRDYVSAIDVGHAFASALAAPGLRGRHVINIGTGIGISAADIARRVCGMIPGAPGPKLGALPDRKEEIPMLVADISAAEGLLGWTPKTGLEQGLRQTVEWYASDGQAG